MLRLISSSIYPSIYLSIFLLWIQSFEKGEVLVTDAWADGVFLTRWIFSDRSDPNRDKWQGILPHLPSAGLTEHCLVHSVLFQAQPHILSGDFDLSIPITWCFLHPYSHNSMVPSLVSAEGVPSSSCWQWLWHFILIWSTRYGHLAKEAYSSHWQRSRGKHHTLQKGCGRIHTDRCGGMVRAHLSDCWFDRTCRAYGACLTPQLAESSPIYASLWLCLWKVFKRSFANRSDGIQRFIMRPLLYTIFKQIMIMRPKVIVKISLNWCGTLPGLPYQTFALGVRFLSDGRSLDCESLQPGLEVIKLRRQTIIWA